MELKPHPAVGQLLLLGSHEGQPELVRLAQLNLDAFARSLPRSLRTPLWTPSDEATGRLPCPTAFHALPMATVAEQIRHHRPLIITNAPWPSTSESYEPAALATRCPTATRRTRGRISGSTDASVTSSNTSTRGRCIASLPARCLLEPEFLRARTSRGSRGWTGGRSCASAALERLEYAFQAV